MIHEFEEDFEDGKDVQISYLKRAKYMQIYTQPQVTSPYNKYNPFIFFRLGLDC